MSSRRIYFSGGTASGKTTLTDLFFPNQLGFERLPSATSYVMEQPAFKDKDITADEEIADLFQYEVFSRQIHLEEKYSLQGFVSDRCLDFISYTCLQCSAHTVCRILNRQSYKKHISYILASEYLLFLCPPNVQSYEAALRSDGDRRSKWLVWENINKVYGILKFLYQVHGIQYQEVPCGTMQEQADFVLQKAKLRLLFPP